MRSPRRRSWTAPHVNRASPPRRRSYAPPERCQVPLPSRNRKLGEVTWAGAQTLRRCVRVACFPRCVQPENVSFRAPDGGYSRHSIRPMTQREGTPASRRHRQGRPVRPQPLHALPRARRRRAAPRLRPVRAWRPAGADLRGLALPDRRLVLRRAVDGRVVRASTASRSSTTAAPTPATEVAVTGSFTELYEPVALKPVDVPRRAERHPRALRPRAEGPDPHVQAARRRRLDRRPDQPAGRHARQRQAVVALLHRGLPDPADARPPRARAARADRRPPAPVSQQRELEVHPRPVRVDGSRDPRARSSRSPTASTRRSAS